MRILINLLILGIQIVLTFIICFCIYMLFALLDNDFGIDGLFGLFIIQPVFAIIISIITIIVCLIAGLPIRFNKKINCCWTTHFYISIIGISCGLILLFLTVIPIFMETVLVENENGTDVLKQTPNSVFICGGWILTAFFLLHFYPSPKMITNLKLFLSPLLGVASSCLLHNSKKQVKYTKFKNKSLSLCL